MSDLERPGIARRTAGAFGAGLVRAARSGLRAELGDRDATFIRRTGPPLRTLTRAWFRPTIRGLEHVPDAGPALLVGNHSGGNLSPDTLILALALARRQGPEREFFQLSENLLLASPWGHVARRLGAVPVNWATASSALARGAAVLAYPGGEQEVHRPSWRGSRVELGGRLGFARLALERAVPVLPVAAFGGQETALFLGPGTWLARPLGLHRLLGSRVAPLSVTIPWGVTIGDPLGHLPLPAKIAIEVLPAIVPGTSEWPERPEQLYELVERRLSRAVARLADDRRLPLLG